MNDLETLKEYAGVLVGSRTFSSFCGKATAVTKEPKGKGRLIISIGQIDMNAGIEKQIDEHLEKFIEFIKPFCEGLTTK